MIYGDCPVRSQIQLAPSLCVALPSYTSLSPFPLHSLFPSPFSFLLLSLSLPYLLISSLLRWIWWSWRCPRRRCCTWPHCQPRPRRRCSRSATTAAWPWRWRWSTVPLRWPLAPDGETWRDAVRWVEMVGWDMAIVGICWNGQWWNGQW